MSAENVVAKHHRHGVTADEILTDDERLRQPVRRRLNRVRQVHAELPAIPQQILKARRVLRRGDDQDIANARIHQHGHRIINHRFIVNRQKLL